MDKLIIEARVNEYATRRRNPHVPWTPEEIVADACACCDAGASIIHFHARQADGAPSHDPREYARTVAGLKSRRDVLIHPTLGANTLDAGPHARLAHVLAMAADPATRPDIVPMDTGSTNLDGWDPRARRFRTTDHLYINTTATLLHFAEAIAGAGLKPCAVAWNLSFLRQALALHASGALGEPLYLGLTFTDGTLLAGHPGNEAGLRAYLDQLPGDVAIVWTAYRYGGDLLELAPRILEAGGHLAIGLGDYHYPGLGCPANPRVVEEVVRIARSIGRDIATPAETRTMLGIEGSPVATG